MNLFRAGSGGEPAIGESSARRKERQMNNWLALAEKGHPTAQIEGDWNCELCRRAGENWKSAEEKQSSFMLLWDTCWSSLPACHGQLLKETDPKWQQKTDVLGIPKQRSRQRTKAGQILPQRHRSSTEEDDSATKLCRAAPSSHKAIYTCEYHSFLMSGC